MKFSSPSILQSILRRPASRNGPRRAKARQGAATVEFAVVIPLLLLLLLGMIEYAQVVNVSQQVSSASRRGARMAARNSTRNVSEVNDFVTNYIAGNIPNASAVQVYVSNSSDVHLTGSELNAIPSGAPLAVEVSLNFDSVRWFHHFVTLDNKVLQSTTTVRRE
jgi:Flp pilus assembly protein TadG